MKLIKNKIFRTLLTVLLALAVPLGVYAVKNGIQPKSSSGGYYSRTVNRMDFTLDKTEFSFSKTGSETETFIADLNFSVRKCEADFYAVIKSVNIEGADLISTVFKADAQNGDSYNPEELKIKTADTLSWQIEISFNASKKTVLNPVFTVEYASGLDRDTADEHILSIPIQIVIE